MTNGHIINFILTALNITLNRNRNEYDTEMNVSERHQRIF